MASNLQPLIQAEPAEMYRGRVKETFDYFKTEVINDKNNETAAAILALAAIILETPASDLRALRTIIESAK